MSPSRSEERENLDHHDPGAKAEHEIERETRQDIAVENLKKNEPDAAGTHGISAGGATRCEDRGVPAHEPLTGAVDADPCLPALPCGQSAPGRRCRIQRSLAIQEPVPPTSSASARQSGKADVRDVVAEEGQKDRPNISRGLAAFAGRSSQGNPHHGQYQTSHGQGEAAVKLDTGIDVVLGIAGHRSQEAQQVQ